MPRAIPSNQWLLLAIVLVAGLADQFRVLQLGEFSALAGLGLLECAAVWLFWLRHPWSPARDLALLFFVLFTIWAIGSLAWSPFAMAEVQILVIFALFLGLLLMSARETVHNAAFAHHLVKALDWMSGLAAAVCLLRVLMGQTDETSPVSVRSVVIVVLIALCYQLAAWQCGSSRRLLAAGGMAVLIIASLSRTASAVALVLFPLSVIFGAGRKGSPVKAFQMLVIGGALGSCLFLYEPIQERLFGSRSLADLRDEGVDSSGRMEMWQDIYDSFLVHPWLGQGVGATKPYTDKPGMYHPHNDYLLLAHDYGILGLSLFLLGLILCGVRLAGRLRRTARDHAVGRQADADRLCLTGLLAVLALLMMMATDNSISYGFVMSPIGVLLGAGLALSARAVARPRPSRPIVEEVPCSRS